MFRLLVFALVWLFHTTTAQGQLKCSTISRADSSLQRCLHQNGRLSTVEAWDAARRAGSFTAFDAKGKQIAHYELRRFAGHASVTARYHANGQLASLLYSSAPDGGIQYYRYDHAFDEAGHETSFTDHSMPDGRPILLIPQRQQPPPHGLPTQPPTTENDSLAAGCAVPVRTVFMLSNAGKRLIYVDLQPVPNWSLTLKPHQRIGLKPGELLLIDSVTTAEHFVPLQQTYAVRSYRRRGKQPMQFPVQQIESKQRRVYHWQFTD